MKSPFVRTTCLILAAVAVVWMVSPACAATVYDGQKGSSNFDYQITFPSTPTGWGIWETVSYNAGTGVATLGDHLANPAVKGSLESGWSGTPWWTGASGISYTTGYTIELSMKVVSDGESQVALGLGAQPSGNNNACGFFWLGTNVVNFGEYGGSWHGWQPGLSTANNTDDFHTFRIAQQAGATNYSLWRDGELLTDTGASAGNQWGQAGLAFGGVGSGMAGGETQIAYLRATPGAWAPVVPEPGTFALLIAGAAGLLAYAWRKRK